MITITRKGSTHNGLSVFVGELEKRFGKLEREYPVCKGRRWRHDYFIPAKKLAVEVDRRYLDERSWRSLNPQGDLERY
jgi:hypothetical protein